MKPATGRRLLAAFSRFPPHSCGGLIEAIWLPRLAAWTCRFPPHSCGGLIEARRRWWKRGRKVEISPAFVRGPH